MKGLFYFCKTIFFFVITSLTGCVQLPNAKLVEVEQLMEQYPDSALMILDLVKYDEFNNDFDKALYGLLFTQAMDKNYLKPNNDTLISFSVNYFKNHHRDDLNLIKSMYYQGRVYFHKNNNAKAITNYLGAKDLADICGEDFWVSMAARGVSDVYNRMYNSAEELTYAQKEFEYIKKVGKQPYLNYAMLDLGRALYNNHRYDESLAITHQLSDSALKFQDAYLDYVAKQLKFDNLMFENKYDEAYTCINEIVEGVFAASEDSLNLCSVLYAVGRMEDAQKLLRELSNDTVAKVIMLKYKIAKDAKDYGQALENLEKIVDAVDSEFAKSVKSNLTGSVSDYFELNNKLDKVLIQETKLKIYIAIILAVLLISLIIGICFFVYIRQKNQLSEKVLLAEQLQDSLDKAGNERSNYESSLKFLMASNYELLEELTEVVRTCNDTDSQKRKIADVVTQIIKDMSIGGDKIIQLEKKVNSVCDNLYFDFKNDLPGLKDVDYMLFLFSVIGLSNAAISLFLKENKIEAVYNRKRRLKNRVKLLDSPNRDRYLKYL